MPLKWNKTTRTQLRGFRRRDANDPPEAWEAPDAARAWDTLRAHPSWTLDARLHADTMQQIVAACASPTPPAFDERVELLRAAWLLGGRADSVDEASWEAQSPERALARFWLASGGVTATLRLLLARPDFAITRSRAYDAHRTLTNDTLIVRAPDANDPSEQNGAWASDRYGFRPSFSAVYQWGGPSTVALWTGVRCAMSALSDADFRAATAEAHAFRATLADDDHWAHAAIAFAFSRDPSHATDILTRLASGPRCSTGHPSRYPGGIGMHLLAIAAPDVETARTVLPFCLVHEIAFDLVESFGDDAAPFLEAAVIKNHIEAQNASHRKLAEKPLAAALKVLGRSVSAEAIEAAVKAKQPVVRTPKPEARSLGNGHFALTLKPGELPLYTEIGALLPASSWPDAYPWETAPDYAADEARGGEREFWLTKVKLASPTPGAIRAWATAQGYRPATLREALAFHHALPDELDAKGYVALGSSCVHLPNLRTAPFLERHKKVGARLETITVASLVSVAEGDQCGRLGVDWRYRPTEPDVESPIDEAARVLLVRA